MWENFNYSGSKMFSLNLAAYILCETKLIPDAAVEESTNTVYFVYPECNAVSTAIRAYKDGTATVNLREFLSAIKTLRTTIQRLLKE